MVEMFKDGYMEEKPHFIKRVVWIILNATVFPLLPAMMRLSLLRLFGAKIAKTRTPIYRSVRIFAPWNLEIGELCCIGPRVRIYNKGLITLGKRVTVSQDAYLCTASHNVCDPNMQLVVKPITLNDFVWVAAYAKILPDVIMGEGSVAGCAAVVTKNVEPWTVVAGNPAKFIKKRILN